MSADDRSPTSTHIEDRLQQVGHYSLFVKAGLGVIILAFLLAVVLVLPGNLDSVEIAVDAVLLPLIFVGMGLLLFGIGMHLHLLHLNLVRQLRKSNDSDSEPSERNQDQ